MILVSASSLDNLMWYYRIESMTHDEIIARLRNEREPSADMEAGIAWHNLIETIQPGQTLDGEIEVDGYRFQFNLDDQIELELPQAQEIFGHKAITLTDGTEVDLRCRADGISGNIIREWKLTKNTDPENYIESYQWRAYLYVFGCPAIEYTLFKKWMRGNLIKIQDVLSFKMYRYPAMEIDLKNKILEYINFCRRYCPDVLEPKNEVTQ